MRVVEASGYTEPRDALAQNWYPFMAKVLPEADWLPIPNLKDEVLSYIKKWQLNGFILTGGNDLFEAPARDQTELAIIKYAEENNLPLLGVCRGLQIICHYYGQEIIPCPERHEHVATTHQVKLTKPYEEDRCIEVNSYHQLCIGFSGDLKEPLKPLALSHDGVLEAVTNCSNILGIMWHPERESPSSSFDKKIIRNHFSLEE